MFSIQEDALAGKDVARMGCASPPVGQPAQPVKLNVRMDFVAPRVTTSALPDRHNAQMVSAELPAPEAAFANRGKHVARTGYAALPALEEVVHQGRHVA